MNTFLSKKVTASEFRNFTEKSFKSEMKPKNRNYFLKENYYPDQAKKNILNYIENEDKTSFSRRNSTISTEEDENFTTDIPTILCQFQEENNCFYPNCNNGIFSNHKLRNNQTSDQFKFKTEICIPFSIYGTCRFGDACAYAHGENELRPKLNLSANYKTKLCKQYSETHQCEFGDRCWFIHSRCLEIKNAKYSMILMENCNLSYRKLNSLEKLDSPYTSIVKTKRLLIFEKIHPICSVDLS